MRVIEVKNLAVTFASHSGLTTAVDHVSFTLEAGETLGLVGESGCGKSTIALALMGLLPRNAQVTAAQLQCLGQDILAMKASDRRRMRGSRLAMVFQDPMTSLNPYLPIHIQVGEHIKVHQKLNKTATRKKVIELLELVEIPKASARLKDYPHQFSGGQRQRILIAMALACDPQVLIADEPTTALDVTVQAQILRLIKRLQRDRNLGVLMITHDMGVVAGMCQRVAVCYQGRIIESADVADVFDRPQQDYTKQLLAAVPRIDQAAQTLQRLDHKDTDPSPGKCHD